MLHRSCGLSGTGLRWWDGEWREQMGAFIVRKVINPL
jgi:hypothetical protein